MKKVVFLIFAIVYSCAFSQNANWGTGLPITASINGSSVNLSVFDPILNQTKTTSLSVGNNPIFQNIDGVVAAYGSYSSMAYATYDLSLQQWKTGSQQLGSNGQVLTKNGAVVGYGSIGSMVYATYDPSIQQWRIGSQQLGSTGQIITEDGVVLGYGSIGSMVYAIYDVSLQQWRTGSQQLGSTGQILTEDGVIQGYGSIGSMVYGTYDISLQQWKTGSMQLGSNGQIATNGGVAAGFGSNGSMAYGVYDFSLQQWRTGSFSLGSNGSFMLNAGTCNYTGSTGSGIRGYNFNTSSWGNNPTQLNCELHSYVSANWVYVRGMSIGATSYTYNCGDGHQIYNRCGWKRYTNTGQYALTLTINNGASNSTCNETINAVNAVEGDIKPIFSVLPNPSNGQITVKTNQAFSGSIKVVNSLGQVVLQSESQKATEISFLIPQKGIFFIQFQTEKELYTQKLIIE
jgi:hypothetical protein